MQHYFIDVRLTASVSIEEHKKGSFDPSSNIRFTHKTAKAQYLKELRAAAKELQKMIDEIECTDELQPVFYYSE